MQNFIRKPSIDLYPGIIVDKDTVIEYETETVHQSVKNLQLHSVSKAKGENYDNTLISTVYLKEGDILLFEENGRGYFMPLNGTVTTIQEAIEDLENIKDLG